MYVWEPVLSDESQNIHVCLRQKFTKSSCPYVLRSELIGIYRRSSELSAK